MGRRGAVDELDQRLRVEQIGMDHDRIADHQVKQAVQGAGGEGERQDEEESSIGAEAGIGQEVHEPGQPLGVGEQAAVRRAGGAR